MRHTDPGKVAALNWRSAGRRHEPRTACVLWTLEKGLADMQALLVDLGHLGAELQVFRDGEFVFGRRFDVPHLATIEADSLRETLTATGWTSASEETR